MTARVKWIDRKFSFDFPADLFPEILERLRGTPARVEHRLKNLPADILNLRPEGAWSIQEHIGHLLDVEPLFAGRMDDFDEGRLELRGADVSGKKTHEAGHNEKMLHQILEPFRQARAALIARLEAYPPKAFGETSLHPRLGVPMRRVDCLFFQAEHDDYHLARITETARGFGAA